MNFNVLIADDDIIVRKSLSQYLGSQGYAATSCGTRAELIKQLENSLPDVILLDLRLPDSTGLELLEEIKQRWQKIPIIMITAHATIETAINAVKKGAFDFLTKPFPQLDVVALAIARALKHKEVLTKLQRAQSYLESQFGLENLVGNSPPMQEIIRQVKDVASSDAAVLITGESGTGKELVARAVHQNSPRHDQEFITCNCGAITESLLESELFGHVKGSFTGATTDKKGIFEIANHGTLFLDEIGDMPQATQVKLLRALQDGDIKRVGDSRSLHVDVRIITATNQNLEELVRKGLFRQDLYYRIHVIRIGLPALRERMEDLEPLISHFIKKYNRKLKKQVAGYNPEFLQVLQKHKWPGNVRELENIIERAVVVAKQTQLTIADIPPSLTGVSGELAVPASNHNGILGMSYRQAKQVYVQSFNQVYIGGLLQMTRGNITQAAEMAGMFRSNFKSLMRKYNISSESYKESVKQPS